VVLTFQLLSRLTAAQHDFHGFAHHHASPLRRTQGGKERVEGGGTAMQLLRNR
jgi:hypothetical protein